MICSRSPGTMAASSLLPRSGSNSNIPLVLGPHFQHTLSSSSFKKLHGRASYTSEPSCCSRYRRLCFNRSVGTLFAILICILSFLMLLTITSRVSLQFAGPSDNDALLEVFNVARIRRLDPDGADHTRGKGNLLSRMLSEESFLRANTMQSSSATEKRNVTLPSDQPLPQDHPCRGFTLPPPPADKKRTGPRPCPVCYLPVEDAIKKMPSVDSSTTSIIKRLSYVVDPAVSHTIGRAQGSEFGGYPSLEERRLSFAMQENMNVHCGFIRGEKPGVGTGFDIDETDLQDMEKCTGIVVASAIFGNYDLLQQPKNISSQSRASVCFFMFVDKETYEFLYMGDLDQNLLNSGVWRVVVVHNMPYSDARRNGKIPKLLLHRLFPNARFSLWIDGKLELVVDPIQVLERFLWRKNRTFAISQHYKRFDVFDEADANKAAGKYDNASIDSQINFYKSEGIEHFDPLRSPFPSDVPEGCVIMREHNPITNLFTCLWFNEVDRFTSRDQLSFAVVRNKLTEKFHWGFSMFLDCERRNFVVQAYHKDLLERKKVNQKTNGTSAS